MFFSKNKTAKRPVATKKTNSKKAAKGWKRSISLNTRKAQFLAFIAIFAILGGSYMVFRSFASTPCRNQVVQNGSRGECVRLFQNAVNVNGWRERLSEDGIFGSKTEQAARDIQTFWGLTVDGKAGPRTADALCYGIVHNGKSAPYCNGASAQAPTSAPSTGGGTTTRPNVDQKTGDAPSGTPSFTCSVTNLYFDQQYKGTLHASVYYKNTGTTTWTGLTANPYMSTSKAGDSPESPTTFTTKRGQGQTFNFTLGTSGYKKGQYVTVNFTMYTAVNNVSKAVMKGTPCSRTVKIP